MIDSTALRHAIPVPRVATAAALLLGTLACGGTDRDAATSVERPGDTPALHHVGLNTTDVERAIDWYLAVWPSAQRTEVAGRPAVASEMYLVFNTVDAAPPGAFDPAIGRPDRQSAFWHIGAFMNTTESDRTLAAVGVEHLPLYTSPDDDRGVWRSGLAPYSGVLTAEGLATAAPAEPRAGGFSYALAPDGVLFELTGGPNTTASMSHVHLFHEHPLCAANWYVGHLGMALPPTQNDDGTSTERPAYQPCEADLGEAGWPSLEPIGTIRQPRATVIHGNGSLSWYPRQCVADRCGSAQPLVPSRGQVLDHVSFSVEDVNGWHRWLVSRGVAVLEEPHDFGDGRAVMIEGPDRLSIELVEVR